MRLWDFINTPCTVKKTYQGHINKNYSIGGCFGLLRSMRKLAAPAAPPPGAAAVVEGDEAEDDFREEQWVEGDSVAFVASASEDGAVVLWDVKTKEVLQRVGAAHEGVCFWVDVHGETGTMVTCGQDSRIVVFRHRLPGADPAQDGEHGERPPNGHAKDGDDGAGHPEEPSEAGLGNGGGDGGGGGNGDGDGDETMRKVGPKPVQTNGHREYPEGVVGEAPSPKDEADVSMSG